MTLPAVGALRERWPEARIEVLGYPHIAELALSRPYADAIRSIEASALAGFFIPGGVLAPEWMEYMGSFHLVVSYLYDPDGIFAANVKRCGVKQFVPGSPQPTDCPAAQHYCRPLESLAIYVTEPQPRVLPDAAGGMVAERLLAGRPRERLAVIHPGSGGEKKNWDTGKFGRLGRWLVDECGAQLLVVKGEADEVPVRRLMQHLAPGEFSLLQGLKLKELAAVLRYARVFVGNDSGITHLAAAVGTRTVALFGPHSPGIWEPRGSQVRVVRFGEDDEERAQRAVADCWKGG